MWRSKAKIQRECPHCKKQHFDSNKRSKCAICGITEDLKFFAEFHHIDPNEKEYQMSILFGRKWTETIEKELNKCLLVCANCHRLIHFKKGEVVYRP